MCYEWEEDLRPFVLKQKIEEVRKLVKKKIQTGRIIKWALVATDIAFITLLLIIIGGLNVLGLALDSRFGLINGVIAFKLALVAFLSPIQSKGSKITIDEVDDILETMVTGDVFKKISQTVDKEVSGSQKWLAIIGACGIFVAFVIKIAG